VIRPPRFVSSFFSPICGISPRRFPDQGRFHHASIGTLPFPAQPLKLIIGQQPFLPHPPEKPGFRPFAEIPVDAAACLSFRSFFIGFFLFADKFKTFVEHHTYNAYGPNIRSRIIFKADNAHTGLGGCLQSIRHHLRGRPAPLYDVPFTKNKSMSTS
jgi:hypothetical protein